jgi:hypothetical protein
MDLILQHFLEAQREEGLRLAAASDLLDLETMDAQRFIASFYCTSLARSAEGRVVETQRSVVGIRFSDDHLRFPPRPEMLTWLEPLDAWHPNIRPPFICIGAIRAGEGLESLLYRCFEVIRFANVTMQENDALNHEACGWARHHTQLFPLDSRPLKRRSRDPLPAVVEVRS